jgi:hypothetical protein
MGERVSFSHTKNWRRSGEVAHDLWATLRKFQRSAAKFNAERSAPTRDNFANVLRTPVAGGWGVGVGEGGGLQLEGKQETGTNKTS